MKTKYNVSLENTFLGPVNTVPESFFNDMMNSSTPRSTQTDSIGNDDNNNPLLFSSLNYECRLKSLTLGEMRFYAGHHKHAFSTCDRPITCKVIKGQMKVKCGPRKWTITENNIIKLIPNSKYFVKNNSLRNECVVTFTFEQN
ncbi:uncharacterized protein LOC129568333 [Sitodiplosis mosellana]|uniref:uncharacterized protein LOC129568333 n=1 Tax=Sitodiplosis mosellana TaxID=263140 RepID=UPI0024449A8E|nr:uncharacterized protein LOC129568333 [Sitodiplosis mosellana]